MSGPFNDPNTLLVVLGPTAVGKTRLAVNIAGQFDGEIISADSRQVYRGMDLGTGKDLADYKFAHKEIPYHLINILEAGEQYNVNAFKNDFYRVYNSIIRKNKLPVLTGGTGLYIQNILQDQPYTAVPPNPALRIELACLEKDHLISRLESYNKDHTKNTDLSSTKRIIRAIEIAEFLQSNELPSVSRPSLHSKIIGLTMEREALKENIRIRLEQRLSAGLVDEVLALTRRGVSLEQLAYYGLEYKFVAAYLDKTMDYATMKESLYTAICQFAKRQMTYFRKMEKDGIKINWFDVKLESSLLLENVSKFIIKG